MGSTSAVFVGNGSLLIQCADVFLDAGHSIQFVASENPNVLQWAQARGLRTGDSQSQAAVSIPADVEFDYLFSIANLQVLPPALLARARRLAINFHDSPLPRYAGVNATTWALIAGETTHGVTWHEMTPRVDAGRVVRQECFSIGANETALGLNARCYEAGLAAFTAITQDIVRGDLALTAPSGERSWFGRERRPDALATLDFSRGADELARIVRSLDFAGYPNPVAHAKVYLGSDILLPRTARAEPASTAAPPGTVLSVQGDELRVATGDGDIVLGGCTDASGQRAAHGLAPGAVLPALSRGLHDQLAARIPGIARGEAYWTQAFTQLAPAELPYPRWHGAAGPSEPAMARLPLRVAPDGARTVAAFFAWLSALCGQERVSALYRDAELAQRAAGLECWLSPWVPLCIDTPSQVTAHDAVANAEARVAQAHEAGPFARDLPARLGEKQPASQRLGRIGICLDAGQGTAEFDLLLRADAPRSRLELVANTAVFSAATANAMGAHLDWYLAAFASAPGRVADVPLIPPEEAQAIARNNATAVPVDAGPCVHGSITAQATRTPDRAAVSHAGTQLSYLDLDRQSDALASRLVQRGVAPGDIVGVCLERGPSLVVAILAIMKSGAAYLPLDPDYPRDRIAFMIADSHTRLVVASATTAAGLGLDAQAAFVIDKDRPGADATAAAKLPTVTPDRAAYVIYTSGSTGRPKGVVVTHRNVMNFFAGMDARIAHDPPGRWLAVTSLSFDISVLELCWTLARGFSVVLPSDAAPTPAKAPDFSLFYFASDNAREPRDRYRLLMEGAKFADQAGFHAVWTPERHFHAFGGLYPNPAVTSAAIAAVTSRVQIRAGSCVLPLHHPIRVAEEWSFVDNISQGRVGVSFASGWQPNDFVLAPAAFADRKNAMLASIDTVRRLWRGEVVAFPGPQGKPVDIQSLPRPIQKELPIWLTAAGNPETFQQAGEMGCHVLTHLLGQNIEDVADKLALYRAAWHQAGHAGRGHVTLMLHTFIGQDDDEVRETVREPMKEYLRSSVDLIRQAAWSFPAFVQRGAQSGKNPIEIMDAEPLSGEDMDALLEHAFSRYYGTSALFGTPARCLAQVEKLKNAGVDEIACLIDFGVAADKVLAQLHDLKQLMDAAARSRPVPRWTSVPQELVRHDISHFQCTPTMAAMLVADEAGRQALSRLAVLMVGGEALPLALAKELRALIPGALLNMYGPTETTVWSTTCELRVIGDFVPLGEPIANTRLHVQTPRGDECPAMVAGELLIGGDGVTQGYWMRPELDAQRFIADPTQPGGRLYRTGDLVRRHPGGALEFLGRMDHQVKILGHRIELGEVEAELARQPGVKEAVVVARDHPAGGKRLVAYVTARPGTPPDPDALRRALARELPDVMVPATVHLLANFPLTPNGKVDRHALPEPQSTLVLPESAAPQSQLEKAIASIWQDVLGLPQVGVTDNFFDLGGHSLLVVQVQRRLREQGGRDISVTDMFRLPTIRALAAHLGGNAKQTAVGDGLQRASARRLMRSSIAAARHTPNA